MNFDFPAIATGVITRLPSGPTIWMDGATHLLTNPMGSIRLRAAEPGVLADLTAVEGGNIPVLLTGQYAAVESVVLVVSAIGRVDAQSLEEGAGARPPRAWTVTKMPSALGIDGWPWVMQGRGINADSSTASGAGNAFTWHGTVNPPKRVSASSARLETVNGQRHLSVDGFELIADTCHHPVARTSLGDRIDDGFTPGVYSIVVGLEKSANVCTALALTREVAWHFKQQIQTSPRLLQIIHASGQVEMVELQH